MSEDLASQIVATVGPLLGVIVGGIISFFVGRGVERERWRRKRQEDLRCLKRDALGDALEWIEPMRSAELSATSLIWSLIRGNMDGKEFSAKFPSLLSVLVPKDVSARQGTVLPENTYLRGLQIVRGFDEVKSLGMSFTILPKGVPIPEVSRQECTGKLQTIREQIDELDKSLQKEFLLTFE